MNDAPPIRCQGGSIHIGPVWLRGKEAEHLLVVYERAADTAIALDPSLYRYCIKQHADLVDAILQRDRWSNASGPINPPQDIAAELFAAQMESRI